MSNERNDYEGSQSNMSPQSMNQDNGDFGYGNLDNGQFGNGSNLYGNQFGGTDTYGNQYGAQNTYGNYENPYQPKPAGYEKPMSLGQWLITLIVLAIPCINIIMLFVWGFGSETQTTKKNFCRATLIFTAIGIVLYFILVGTIAAQLIG